MKRTVAVDANPMTRPAATGTEIYTREIVARLPAAAPDLRFRLYAARPLPAPGPDLVVLPLRRLWSQARLPAALWAERPELFFAPAHVVPFLAPGTVLTTVHDLAFEHFPEAYGRAQRAYLQATTRWAVRRCRLLLTVSQATRRDLVDLYGADPARVRVVAPGVAPPPVAAPSRLNGLPERFALHLGRVEPRKNQLAALDAVSRVGGLRLVCAGSIVSEDMAGRLRAGGAVLLGRVDEGEREALFRAAAALVFPSLYEGFGFPVLEAMARGVPVVTVRGSALPEAGGDAALYAAGPEDVDGLAEALGRVLEDGGLRRRLVAAGRTRAATFTWERTAEGVVAVMRELLG